MREEEARLFGRARDGDVDAFAELVRLLERRIRALLGRLLDDERNVEEAAQDTVVQAWRNSTAIGATQRRSRGCTGSR